MDNFENIYRDAVGEFSQSVSPQVKIVLEKLYQEIQSKSNNVARIRELFIELFEFLNTPEGKTQANCKAVSLFISFGDYWNFDPHSLPDELRAIVEDIKGNIPDIIEAEEKEYNTDKILERLKDSNLGEAEKLYTIATFDQSTAAHIARVKLESEGIECFIADESMMTLNPLYSVAVGAIKLQVKESDAKRASEILKQKITPEMTSESNKCPLCNSPNIFRAVPNWSLYTYGGTILIFIVPFMIFPSSYVYAVFFLVVTMLTLFMRPRFTKQAWECKECSYQWLITKKII